MVKNPPADAGDGGSIPGSGRSGEGNGNLLNILTWEIPRTEKLSSMGLQRVRHDLATKQPPPQGERSQSGKAMSCKPPTL